MPPGIKTKMMQLHTEWLAEKLVVVTNIGGNRHQHWWKMSPTLVENFTILGGR
jgi:hypothetical protein